MVQGVNSVGGDNAQYLQALAQMLAQQQAQQGAQQPQFGSVPQLQQLPQDQFVKQEFPAAAEKAKPSSSGFLKLATTVAVGAAAFLAYKKIPKVNAFINKLFGIGKNAVNKAVTGLLPA